MYDNPNLAVRSRMLRNSSRSRNAEEEPFVLWLMPVQSLRWLVRRRLLNACLQPVHSIKRQRTHTVQMLILII